MFGKKRPTLFTQRRSVAKSVGRFQRRLFVCQQDYFGTSERANMGQWNSGVGALYKNLDIINTVSDSNIVKVKNGLLRIAAQWWIIHEH